MAITYSIGWLEGRPPGWILNLSREATEEDLEESHLLEQVGEVIWTVVAEVRHCPYCGERLPELEPSELVGIDELTVKDVEDLFAPSPLNEFGVFALQDFEAWTGRLR